MHMCAEISLGMLLRRVRAQKGCRCTPGRAKSSQHICPALPQQWQPIVHNQHMCLAISTKKKQGALRKLAVCWQAQGCSFAEPYTRLAGPLLFAFAAWAPPSPHLLQPNTHVHTWLTMGVDGTNRWKQNYVDCALMMWLCPRN